MFTLLQSREVLMAVSLALQCLEERTLTCHAAEEKVQRRFRFSES